MDRLQQHPACATRRVIDGFAFLRIEDVDHQPHYRARRIELAGLLVRRVGKLLDQVFIGLPENVCPRRLIAEIDAREVFDQVAEQRIRQPVLVRPLRVAEYTVERFWVGRIEKNQRIAEAIAPAHLIYR